jgi:hypothetical protein
MGAREEETGVDEIYRGRERKRERRKEDGILVFS